MSQKGLDHRKVLPQFEFGAQPSSVFQFQNQFARCKW